MWNSDRRRIILIYRDLRQLKNRTATAKMDIEEMKTK